MVLFYSILPVIPHQYKQLCWSLCWLSCYGGIPYSTSVPWVISIINHLHCHHTPAIYTVFYTQSVFTLHWLHLSTLIQLFQLLYRHFGVCKQHIQSAHTTYTNTHLHTRHAHKGAGTRSIHKGKYIMHPDYPQN